MGSILFFGHGKTEMRGGPAIFMSLYNQWPNNEKYMIYEKSYLQSLKKLFVFLRHREVSMLILENEYFTEVFIALLLKIFNRKLSVYGPAYHIPSSPVFGKGFINSMIHYVDYQLGLWSMAHIYSGIYTENSYMKNYITHLNPEQKVIVESPGIREKNIISLANMENLDRDIDFLYLTSMTKNKGIYDFLEIIKQLQQEHKDVKVCIAGYASNEVLDYINAFVKNNNIKNIEIYHDIDERQKYKLYSRSKIYVLPSIEDGIPITFYEAWSSGNIVIAYKLETYSDIADYFVGVKRGNINDLIQECKNVYRDYNVYFDQFVEKSHDYSMKHSYEGGIEKIIESIRESSTSINRGR